MNKAAVEAADMREVAKTLLDTVDVSRIVVVDDEYAASVADLLGICSDLDAADVAGLPHLAEIDVDAPDEFRSARIREVWDGLETTERRALLSHARTVAGAAPDEGDDRAASALEGILGDIQGLDFVTLSLAEWRRKSNNLMQDAKAERTMFCFDRDFRWEEPGTEDEGLRQISSVQSENVGYCGLLSHTVPLRDEYEAWNSFSIDHGLERDKFVVISKERLNTDPPDLRGFLAMLRLAALSPRYDAVKSKTWSVFHKSLNEAKLALDKLSVHHFDKAVFGSSRAQGIWEPDTLVRLFGILLRREARSRLYNNEEIFAAVAEARRVSAVEPQIAHALFDLGDAPEALQMQRFEMYEPGDELNRIYAPVELGDIFSVGANGKHYILLAQPCDLMARKGGKRNYEDGKLARMVTMAEIVTDPEEQAGEIGESRKELLYYDADSGRSAFANLARFHQVALSVLDLCVYRQDGVASIDASEEDTNAVVIPSWKARYPRLLKVFKNAMVNYRNLKERDSEERLALLAFPRWCTTLTGGAAAEGDVVRYEVTRVMRLRQPWSTALLTQFAQYQARAAFVHPFWDRTDAQRDTD